MITTDSGGADNGDAKDGVPAAPPPTYAEVAASKARPAQRESSQPSTRPPALSPPPPERPQPPPLNNAFAQPMASSPPPRNYGPTPIPTSQPDTTTILPYYDPRSPWALQEATSRARWRFFGALFWGVVIWLAIGSLVGGMVDEKARRGGSWAVE